jgi:flagellar operon protein
VNVQRSWGYGGLAPVTARKDERARADAGFDGSFDALLRDPGALLDTPVEAPVAEPRVAELRFSRHAAARLQSRGIEISPETLEELSVAVEQLADRGARESLVLLEDHAFVVGVPARTVITALPRNEAMGTIFTNIDSTYVVR